VVHRGVFDMMSKGQSEGVFQFESAGMKRVLTQLKPNSLEDWQVYGKSALLVLDKQYNRK